MKHFTNLLELHPQDFIAFLRLQNINAFHFVYEPQSKMVLASHPQLQAIADFIQKDRHDFLAHEAAFFQISKNFDTLQAAFVHCSVRGQAAGGTRYWNYDTVEAFLRDGLRLSKGMTRKNALAGLWWGGGKGLMAYNPEFDKHDLNIRKSLYQEYGEFMTRLAGCYITAEDAGTGQIDMENIFTKTRFTTCIPPSLGGSGNPSTATAQGIVCGMEAILEFMQLGDLKNKTIAIQGIGNVGTPLIGFLLEKGVKQIIASDIQAHRLEALSNIFPNKNLELLLAQPGNHEFLATECDILAPCGLGGILNSETIPLIRSKIICGAANNQLKNTESDDQLLFDRGITYLPDFLVNRMGIVNCANEQYGYVDQDWHIQKHFSKDWEFSIHQTALEVLKQSRNTNTPTGKIADQLADKLAQEPHPIFGHRGKQIIDSLVRKQWHKLV